MKHQRMLALAAVAAGALMAFAGAGTVSAATEICSTTANPCFPGQVWATGTALDFSVLSGSKVTFAATNGEGIMSCTGGTIEGRLSSANTWPVEKMTFSGCVAPITIVAKGKLEVKRIAGTSNGTLITDATMEWTMDPLLLGDCSYKIPPGTSLGDVTEGKPAVIHLNAVIEGNGFPCWFSTVLTGTYTLTSPSTTTFSVSG
jgi:hypothetical protein